MRLSLGVIYSIPILSPFMLSLYALVFKIRIFYLLGHSFLNIVAMETFTIEELRSNYQENCLRLFLLVVVMETIQYMCVPSYTFIHANISKLEK